MDYSEKYHHALIAVLSSIKKAGGDLNQISSLVEGYSGSKSSPIDTQNREAVVDIVRSAIYMVRMSAIPDATDGPGAGDGTINMQCPDCKGKRELPNGEKCEMCQGTGAVVQYT